ncbi:hypothetical protein SUGI_0359600, partial [Cryptomeria japonica]
MGIWLSFVATTKGCKQSLTMPSSTSLERRVIVLAFGFELVLTDPDKGMGGTINKAGHILESTHDAFTFQQFKNTANIR